MLKCEKNLVMTPLIDGVCEPCRVRHEAAEALGAIAAPDCLQLLQQHSKDPCQEVAETCQLALGRLQYLEQRKLVQQQQQQQEDEQSPYYSVDPTPALPASTPVEQLRQLLLDPQAPMFEVRAGRDW